MIFSLLYPILFWSIDDEFVIRKLKKDIANLKEFSNPTADEEIQILESFLPQQMSEEKLQTVVESIVVAADNPNMGLIMKELKDNYAGLYDGKTASKIAKEVLNGTS